MASLRQWARSGQQDDKLLDAQDVAVDSHVGDAACAAQLLAVGMSGAAGAGHKDDVGAWKPTIRSEMLVSDVFPARPPARLGG